MGAKQSTRRKSSKKQKSSKLNNVVPENESNNHAGQPEEEELDVVADDESSNKPDTDQQDDDLDTLPQMPAEITKRPLARASTSSSSRHSRGSRDSRVSKRLSFYDIVDANDVTSYLVVGNQASALDDEFLTRKKITFVMNMSNLPLEYIKPDVEYKNVFLEDEEEADLLSVLEICLQALKEWKMRCLQTKKRVLVYSYNGLSRSCSVVLAHLMSEERLTLKQAWIHLKEKHPSAKPNDGFLLQLMQYEQDTLERKLSMTMPDFYSK